MTLARPDVRNAFNAEVIAQLHDVFTRITAADDVRAVVLAGEGKVFCGGADINWMRASLELSYDANVGDAERMSDMYRAIDSCRSRSIGADSRRGARRRRRTCGRLRHRDRRRRRDLRLHRGEARHHSRGDLAVRPREDRRVARARAFSYRRALRCEARAERSAWCTRSSPIDELDEAVEREFSRAAHGGPDARSPPRNARSRVACRQAVRRLASDHDAARSRSSASARKDKRGCARFSNAAPAQTSAKRDPHAC